MHSPLKLKLALAYVRTLESRDALESWLNAVAVVWGVSVFTFDAFFVVAYNAPLLHLTLGHADLLGAFIAVVGFIGFIASLFVGVLARVIRTYTALISAFFWGLLTVYFATRVPPISSAVAVYGMVCAAEVWVYVRVSGYFDQD